MTLLTIYHNNIDTVFISPSLRRSARVDYGTMQLASVLKTSAGEGLTIQSAPRCAVWLIFTLLILAIAITQARSASATTVWLLALYGMQGLTAELLGVKTDQTSLTIPRRVLPILPLLVFWRERIYWEDIANITTMSKPVGSERIWVRKRSGGHVPLTFANHDQKLRFFEIAKQMQPMISIYRRG